MTPTDPTFASEATLEAAGLAPCGCDYILDGGDLLFRPVGDDEAEWCEICWSDIDQKRKDECLDIMARIAHQIVTAAL